SFAHGKSIYTLGQPEEAKSFPGIDERPCFRVYSTFMKIGKKTFPPGVYMHGFKPGTEKKEPTLIDKCICGEFTLMLFLVIPMG
ncbi:MAG: hypothetical protein U1E13_14425, partial [Methylophilaceae bacterium]|nr:hypothetical protein [Methylophilaceae bacterium]